MWEPEARMVLKIICKGSNWIHKRENVLDKALSKCMVQK